MKTHVEYMCYLKTTFGVSGFLEHIVFPRYSVFIFFYVKDNMMGFVIQYISSLTKQKNNETYPSSFN